MLTPVPDEPMETLMTAVNRTLHAVLVKALGLLGSLVVLPFAVAGRRQHP